MRSFSCNNKGRYILKLIFPIYIYMSRRYHQYSNDIFPTSSTIQPEQYSCNPNENLTEAIWSFLLAWLVTYFFAYFLYKIYTNTAKFSLPSKIIIRIGLWIVPLCLVILFWDDTLTQIVIFWLGWFIAGFFWYLIISYILSFFLKPLYNHYITLIIITLSIVWVLEDILRACKFGIPGAYVWFILFMLVFPYFRITVDRRENFRILLKTMKTKIPKLHFANIYLSKIYDFFTSLNVQQKIIVNITGIILISILTFALTEWEFNDYDGTWFVWFLNFWVIWIISYRLWSNKK